MSRLLIAPNRWLIATGVVALALILIWAFRGLATPLITDEIAYLMFAKQFAGENLATFGGIGGYRFGQGLLLMPAFLIGETVETTYKLAIGTSCLMTALVPVVILAIAREIGFECNWKVVAAAFIVTVMPAYLYHNALVWPETSFRLFFLVSIYLFARSWRTARTVDWLALVMSVGWLYALHPRAAGIFAVTALMLYVARTRKRVTSNLSAFLLLAALVAVAVSVSVIDKKMQALTFGGGRSDAQAVGILLRWLVSPDGLRRALVVTMGQSWAQVAGSFGLYLIGLISCWRLIKERPGITGTVAFALLSCAAVFAASVAQMVQFSRIDHIIYGRYNDGVSTFFVWLGLCATISGLSHRNARMIVGTSVFVLALGTYLLSIGMDYNAAVLIRPNIPESSMLLGDPSLLQSLLVLSLVALAVSGVVYQVQPSVAVAAVLGASAVIGFAEKRHAWVAHQSRAVNIESAKNLFSRVPGNVYWDIGAATYPDTLFSNFQLQAAPFVDLSQRDIDSGDAAIVAPHAEKPGYGCIGVLPGGSRLLVRGADGACK